MWPLRRSPSLSARSTFRRRPSGSRPSVVRASVSGETSAMNRAPARRTTVRQAPLTATLSPRASRASGRGVAMVRRAPAPLGSRRSRWAVAWMMPVNTPLDDRLRAVEEAPEPRVALARRQRFELAAVEPDAPARRTLVDGHVLIRDGREGLGATRTVESVGRRLLVAAETRQELAIALGEEAVLVRLLLLLELVAEPVLLIRHGSPPSTG